MKHPKVNHLWALLAFFMVTIVHFPVSAQSLQNCGENLPDVLILNDFLPKENLEKETDFRAIVTQVFSDKKDSVTLEFAAPKAGYHVAVLLKHPVGTFTMYYEKTWTIHPADQIKKEKQQQQESEVHDLAWSPGAVHQYSDTVRTASYTFNSDSDYPLTFKVVKGKGYAYLCGRGTVKNKTGKIIRLGYGDTTATWLKLLASGDVFAREAATQALGFLAKTSKERDLVVPSLVKALEDPARDVRRNAAEALGRLADPSATDALTSHTLESVEKDQWVRKVAEESLRIINP